MTYSRFSSVSFLLSDDCLYQVQSKFLIKHVDVGSRGASCREIEG